MALPKIGLRNIIVDDVKYAWKITGNDGWIDLLKLRLTKSIS
ncbi:MAG TPA: hypothetical protein VLJ41_16465 [Segetibacter sp.]|nr:hypothetical protein [Segetibacter sp.]